MTLRARAALLATLMLLAGCDTDPDIKVIHRVPHGATIAVVALQDCVVANQADCAGSGATATSIFVRVLSQKPGLHALALPRPVGADAPITDEKAVAYAQAKGYRYVINGQVLDYLRTGHLALHSDRAAVSLRLLSTKDGQTLVTYNFQEDSKTHFTSPDDMLEDMAKQLATSIIVESKKQRQGDFMFYKPNGSN